MKGFKELGLSEDILKVLEKKGFEQPSLIQQKTIPAILKGKKDLIGQAHTGTGKTAAFGLPIIESLDTKSKSVQALVLTPTRELAISIFVGFVLLVLGISFFLARVLVHILFLFD